MPHPHPTRLCREELSKAEDNKSLSFGCQPGEDYVYLRYKEATFFYGK